ncbi:WD40-repeat-containing domain protein [Multifurca ochricompacta]|uniref:WD40-repeat-containing domain protein n=1 Tax=Multifurca ochricompacta TaxID=376703 RepID=A0AAD4M4Z8_9AGAM|nr:WD40-repeat-containing domain protein [Multifurca ochricompacta]
MPARLPVSSVTPSHIPDFNAVPTPESKPVIAGNSRRRKALITLLDVLGELTRDENLGVVGGRGQQPSLEDDRDIPSVDEHLQQVGADSFDRFQRRVNNLDNELRNFSNAARQLGSSVGILSSAFHLRERLAQIAWLFRENAADLFPRKVSHQSAEGLVRPDVLPRRKRARSKAPPHVRRPLVLKKLDPENFPSQLGLFARDVITFLHCLNEFPEFTDEALNASIIAFEGDLKYWASCLKAYEGQFKYPAVQRYLHDLLSEIGEHVESITSSLSVFIEIGVPTIRFAQKHGATNLLNLSTVATFFSAVTATTLQYTFDSHNTPLEDAVNAFWFTSMVFSIAAAVNSLLGLTWKQAMYRSPGNRVPWWVLIWIKRSPLVFLVLSVACFSVGLVLFAYSSQQNFVVSTITTVFTAFSSFGLVAVSTWFASERWVFARHKGKKWLQDSLDDLWDAMISIPPFHQFVECLHALGLCTSSVSRGTRAAAMHASSVVTSFFQRRSAETLHPSSSENTLPTSPSPDAAVAVSPRTRRGSENTAASPASLATEAKSMHDSTVSFSLPSEKASGNLGIPTSPERPRARFAQAVRSVIRMQQAAAPKSPRTRSLSPSLLSPDRIRRNDSQPVPMQNTRVATLLPKLRALAPTQDLAAHQALVRHLQFSPDGRFLATSSWDRTSVIFHAGDPFTLHRTLAHPSGFVSQVAWSPSGNLVLTKLVRSIKVWTEAGVCSKTIDRYRPVQSICWLPGGEAFMSVEGSDVIKLDLTGKVLDTYHFERLMIHDVSVTSDGQRLLGVGTLLSSTDGLQPSRCRAEKRIIAYNLDQKEIENQVPVLHDVRHITLAGSGRFALVSYEFKAPTQLWKLEMVKDRNKLEAPATSRLSLRHTYLPKYPVDFAGPSHFGGSDDQLVLCAGKAGDIHIWDRESGALLHHVRSQSLGGGDLTCIAWNPAADPYMFATGSHDGAVRIWTAQPIHARDTGGRSGSVTPLSDVSSQLHLDIENHGESSTGQQRSERILFRVETLPPTESIEDIAGPSLPRSITFSPSQA